MNEQRKSDTETLNDIGIDDQKIGLGVNSILRRGGEAEVSYIMSRYRVSAAEVTATHGRDYVWEFKGAQNHS